MSYTEITYSVADNVATLTLHRPDKLNAFTGVMMAEMIDAFDKADADDDVRVVVARFALGPIFLQVRRHSTTLRGVTGRKRRVFPRGRTSTGATRPSATVAVA